MKKFGILLFLIIITGYFTCFFEIPIKYRVEKFIEFKFKETVKIDKIFENNFGAGVYIIKISNIDSTRLANYLRSSKECYIFEKGDYKPNIKSFAKNGFKYRMTNEKQSLFIRDSLTPMYDKTYLKEKIVPFGSTNKGSIELVFGGHTIYYSEQGYGFQD